MKESHSFPLQKRCKIQKIRRTKWRRKDNGWRKVFASFHSILFFLQHVIREIQMIFETPTENSILSKNDLSKKNSHEKNLQGAHVIILISQGIWNTLYVVWQGMQNTWNFRYRMFIKYCVFFPRILESLPPLPCCQYSAVIGCTKNYQPIGVAVH